MRIKMARIKLRNARDNRARVNASNIDDLGRETGEFLTLATIDVLEAAELLLRELLVHNYSYVEPIENFHSISETSANILPRLDHFERMTFTDLIYKVPNKYQNQLWYSYLKDNASRIKKWLSEYRVGHTIRLQPGQYGTLVNNIEDLCKFIASEFPEEETYEDKINFILFEINSYYTAADVIDFIPDEIDNYEDLKKAIITATTIMEN